MMKLCHIGRDGRSVSENDFCWGRHWLKKWAWRERKDKNGSPNGSISRVEEMQMMKKGSSHSASISDLDSPDQGGYHLL